MNKKGSTVQLDDEADFMLVFNTTINKLQPEFC